MRARRALVLVAAVNALLLGMVLFVLLRAAGADDRADEWHGTAIVPPMEKRPFTLQSAAGPLRSSDLRGSVSILFFGYTSCPDACPLTLARLAEARRALSRRDASAIRVVLVTVDPERDGVDRLEDYVTRFDTSFIGVTGTRSEIEAVARDFGIHHARDPRSTSASAPDHDGHVTAPVETDVLAHTTHVLVLDRSARLALVWSPEVQAGQMVEDLRRLLGT